MPEVAQCNRRRNYLDTDQIDEGNNILIYIDHYSPQTLTLVI